MQTSRGHSQRESDPGVRTVDLTVDLSEGADSNESDHPQTRHLHIEKSGSNSFTSMTSVFLNHRS